MDYRGVHNVLCVVVLVIVCSSVVQALENGLARTPPMGWLSWERFRCNTDCKNDPDNCISDRLFRTMTDLVVSEGYAAVGYEYINIDDCWLEKERSYTGQLVPDRVRFPFGLRDLADYLIQVVRRILEGKPEGKRPVGRPRMKWENNINHDLREVDYTGDDWKTLAQDRDVSRAYIRMAMNLRIHGKGLKFGIYEDYGNYTCAGYPGILGYLETDAQTFASWDVDYVKLDGCYSHPRDMDRGYPEFGYHLNRTGRPMIYSCSWPVYQIYSGMSPNYTSIIENCNLWRNFDDIQDSWASLESIIDYYGNNQDVIVPNAGPGHWNDPDMLIIGNFGLSYEQSKTQMALWAILAAPLLMSVDLRTIRPEYKAILQNKKIIAVDQDPLGYQGRRIYKHNGIEIWARPITPVYQNYFSYAVAFLNRRTDGTPSDVAVTLRELGLSYPGGYNVEYMLHKLIRKYLIESVVILRADIQVRPQRQYAAPQTQYDPYQVFQYRPVF
ncbi:hypothetical protein C0J52_01592 [Blattella germanica]|nr:hypothetical protein C0J52_01592 [Blattella germanica]